MYSPLAALFSVEHALNHHDDLTLLTGLERQVAMTWLQAQLQKMPLFSQPAFLSMIAVTTAAATPGFDECESNYEAGVTDGDACTRLVAYVDCVHQVSTPQGQLRSQRNVWAD